MTNILDEIEQIADLIKNGKIKIFCGAGISYNSGVPLVEPLIKRILKIFGATEKEIEVFKLSKYPFEAFMDAIGYNFQGRTENQITEQIKKLFKIGSPNNNHNFISSLYRLGMVDKVVTTNFDCHIENVLKNNILFKSFKNEREFNQIKWNIPDNTLIKIHGCISDPQSIRTTLDGVSNQLLHPEREKIIQNTFLTGTHEAVLVLGYSFSDHFDITPFLNKISNSSKKVYVINHSFDDPSVKNISQIFPQISNFTGRVLCGNTDSIIKSLWEKILDIPYDESINTNCKLSLHIWEEIIENLKAILSEDEGYKKFILGHLFQEIHRTEIAKKYFNLLIDSNYSKLYRGKELIGLSNVYRTEGDFKSILKSAEEALEIAIELEDKDGIIACYTHLGTYYKRIEEFDKAIETHIKAIKLISNAPEFNIYDRQKYLSDQIYNIGLVYLWKGKLDISFRKLSTAEEFARNIGNEYVIAHILENKGIIFQRKAEIFYKFQFMPLALMYYNQSLEKARSLEIPTLIIDNLMRIGKLGSTGELREKLGEAE